MLISEDKLNSVDDILGPREQRFFGKGFQKVNHLIKDIEIINNDDGKGLVKAKATILYPSNWSKKSDDVELEPHVSTIDAFVLSVQLNEIYLINKFQLNEQQRKKMWIRRIVMKAGSTPQEDLHEFLIHTKHISTKIASEILCGNISIFESQIGTIKVRCEIAHELEEENNNSTFFKSTDEVLGPGGNRYYGDGYKIPQQIINNVTIDTQNLSVNALIKIENIENENLIQEGIEAHYRPVFSMVDCIVTIAQMAQALIYKMDNIDRTKSNTLWMRKVIIESNSPYQPLDDFIASTHILGSKLLDIKGSYWRTSDMVCECQGIQANYSIAHELPSCDTSIQN